jgi:hypothetical protein
MRDFVSQRRTAVGRVRREAICKSANERIIVHPYSAGTSLARAERASNRSSWSNPVGCADLVVVKISHSSNGMNCPYSLSPDMIFDSLTHVSFRANLFNGSIPTSSANSPQRAVAAAVKPCAMRRKGRAITGRQIDKGITERSECFDICSHYSYPVENATAFP